MKYEIDSESADNICKNVLGETIKALKESIKKNKAQIEIRGSKAPVAWLEDLECDKKTLEACKIIYQYFGGKK